MEEGRAPLANSVAGDPPVGPAAEGPIPAPDGGGGPRHSRIPLYMEQQEEAASFTDGDYFRAYSRFEIHEVMAKDSELINAFKSAILLHKSSIEGKVVLDIGCGLGFLSVFCATIGEAKKVFAVDGCALISQEARKIVDANGLSEKIIVISSKIEDIQLEIQEKVDVIISNWMGHMLLDENMIHSIIFARDRWLIEGGIILPSHAKLFMGAVTHDCRYQKVHQWNDLHGIDMSTLKPLVTREVLGNPVVDTVSSLNLIGDAFEVLAIDCYNVKADDLKISKKTCSFRPFMDGLYRLHAFGFWFTIKFRGPAYASLEPSPPSKKRKIASDGLDIEEYKELELTTAPDHFTHWGQTLMYLFNPIRINYKENLGNIIEGYVSISQDIHSLRFLSITLSCTAADETVDRVATFKC